MSVKTNEPGPKKRVQDSISVSIISISIITVLQRWACMFGGFFKTKKKK